MSAPASPAPDTPEHPFVGDPVFDLHHGGKMGIRSAVELAGSEELSLAYTPGVARVCTAIAEDPTLTQHYTWVPNTVRKAACSKWVALWCAAVRVRAAASTSARTGALQSDASAAT